MKALEDLFLDELADIYDAEKRLTQAMPKMIRMATHQDLREAFQNHLDETEAQVKRVEEVFACFDKPAKGKKCEAIAGLIKEAEDIASENKGSPTINAALISAVQKIEHYEIASYGCLSEWAEQLDNEQAAELLEQTLDEEKAADKTLTQQARQRCNESAQIGQSDNEQEVTGRWTKRKGSKQAARSRA